MPPRSGPPPSLRRAAARPAVRGRAPSQSLIDAADAGLLTRQNTKRGTVGRQAVYGRETAQRLAAAPDLPAREALGHRVKGSRPRTATFFADEPPRVVVVEGGSLRDVHRSAAYMGEVGGMIGRLRDWPGDAAGIKRAWERRWMSRAPIAGLPVLADADAAIALADELRASGEELIFDSGRSRPGRQRRTRAPSRRSARGQR